jgi:hypothetical protein
MVFVARDDYRLPRSATAFKTAILVRAYVEGDRALEEIRARSSADQAHHVVYRGHRHRYERLVAL